MDSELVPEVLGEIELTKELIIRRLWLRDFLVPNIDLMYSCRQWEPGDKIQVVWQHKPWPEEGKEKDRKSVV